MIRTNVRRLDEEVVIRQRLRASRNKRSLEGEARHILKCAAADMVPKRALFLQVIERLRPLNKGRKHIPSEMLIREDRDRGHCDTEFSVT